MSDYEQMMEGGMSIDIALLLLRVVVGLLFVGHGSQKLFGGFGGVGLAGMAGWLGSLGMRPAGFWALMAGLSEAGGGVLLALGLLSPLGTLGITAAMLVAIVTAHWGRLWAAKNGMELPLVYLIATTSIALAGPGAYSLDSAFGIALPMPLTWLGGLALVGLGVATALGSARQPAVTQPAEADSMPRAA
jgi:putative oxidoreductase